MSRLLAAWVRTWTSSPIATPCAASECASTGPLSLSASDRTGATASPSSTRRSTAPGGVLAQPGDVAAALTQRRPGRQTAASSRRPKPGWWYPSRWPWAPRAGLVGWRPGDLTRDQQGVGGLDVVDQPSATTAAPMERCSGSHASPSSIAGPACSRARPSRPGTTSPAGRTPVSSGMPVSSLHSTSALASSTRAVSGPDSRRSAASASGSPLAGTRHSTCTHGRPCAATDCPNSGSPTLTTPTSWGSKTGTRS